MNLKKAKRFRRVIREHGIDPRAVAYEVTPRSERLKVWPAPVAFDAKGNPQFLKYATCTYRIVAGTGRHFYNQMKRATA